MESKDDLVIKQIDFYFGDSNFPRDKFLRAQAALSEDGWVGLDKIITFSRVQKLGVADIAELARILQRSEVVMVNPENTMIKRKNPIPGEDTSAPRTVFAKGFNQEVTIEKVEEAFKEFAPIKCVRIRKNRDKTLKGSVFVELENVEKAQQAAAKGKMTVDGNEITLMMKDQYFKEKKEKKKRKQEEKKKGTEADGEERPAKKQKKEEKPLEYTKECVIQFKGVPDTTDRETIKSALENIAKIQFIDFKRGTTSGYIRFTDAEETKKAFKALVEDKLAIGGNVTESAMLTGEDEEKYFKQIADNKKKKHGGGRGGRGRGRGGRKRF
eukprot:TRINITY_DN723_c0_g4_i1.p1 TRINITY_DN723_c0_g4~~TRINITY_DN723_c0_g4_i1.p1  ORF type:complete len:326 (-),score=148.66 TRINITY_DN723_c0_g4_i1:58-1035(-)